MKQYIAPIVAAGLVAGAGAGALAVSPALAQSTSTSTNPPVTRPFFGGLFAFRSTAQIDAQANLLGISADDLLARLVKGETMQQILKDLNIAPADLKAKMQAARQQQITDMKNRIQALVTAGSITQAQADAYIQKLTTPPQMPNFKRGMGNFKGMMHHGAQGAPAPSTSSS